MKELHIIESETPGISVLKFKKRKDKKPEFAIFSKHIVSSQTAFKIYRETKMYEGKKILKIYRSSWNSDEFFIKHFM